MIGRVEDRRDELEVLAVFEAAQELRDRERLAADDAVLVSPADPDLAKIVLGDRGSNPLGPVPLRVVPERVVFDEAFPCVAFSHAHLFQRRWSRIGPVRLSLTSVSCQVRARN